MDDGSTQDEEVESEPEEARDSDNVSTTSTQASSSQSSRVDTPPPVKSKSRLTPGKRRQNKQDQRIESKLLEIIHKPEEKADEDQLFCMSLAGSLRKITDPQRKEYAKLQIQQCVYNCLYGASASGASNRNDNYQYTVSDGQTFTSF